MRLFKYTCGVDEKIGVFRDENEAYEKRASVDPTFHFLPVVIEEITVPGYEIIIRTNGKPESTTFEGWTAEELRAWLDEQKVEFPAKASKKELLELCALHHEQQEQERKITDIARLCYEVNRAYCLSIGDNSQPKWEDAAEWQKESVINGVKFHLENQASPEESHENWMKEKVESGWVYGETKDPEKKTHPCLVPYDQLPVEQRAKDYIFKAIVETYK